MLIPRRVGEAIEGQREAFRRAAERTSEARERYLHAWHTACRLGREGLQAELGGVPWPGARPSAELDSYPDGIVPFGRCWQTAQEARVWALETLHGATTVGIDGSQIAASKEFGVPVSLVQVAWFENPHDAGREYRKDVRNQVLTPDDPPEDLAEFVFADSRVNQCRYVLEMQVAAERVQALAPQPVPLLFHDGSFVLSFTGRMPPVTRDSYLDALFAVLRASTEHRIPVAGYVDRSFASDLTTMLGHACDLPPSGLYDALLLNSLLQDFDRTVAFQCARGDILTHYRRGDEDLSGEIFFVYLKTGRGHLPARIDVPRWVLDAGLLDRAMDLIRAEIVVGSGYPYALETADAAAVLTTEDRLAFYRLWHERAREWGLEVGLPSKSLSKLHRR